MIDPISVAPYALYGKGNLPAVPGFRQVIPAISLRERAACPQGVTQETPVAPDLDYPAGIHQKQDSLRNPSHREAIQISGTFLAKLDGTAKGGIVVAIRDQLGIPVKFIGLGEKPTDIQPFDPDTFVEALFA